MRRPQVIKFTVRPDTLLRSCPLTGHVTAWGLQPCRQGVNSDRRLQVLFTDTQPEILSVAMTDTRHFAVTRASGGALCRQLRHE